MKTIDPEPPNLQEAYKIHKVAKHRGSLIERYFTLDHKNFLQYSINNLKAPCKTTPLINSQCVLEYKTNFEGLKEWPSKFEDYRLKITLKNAKEEAKVLYCYSDDINFIMAIYS
jgi:hypothetical protein